MYTPAGFPSWSNYAHFILAREFAPQDPTQQVPIAQNRLEVLGHALSLPVAKPFNYLLREIRNPLVILSLAVSLVALATLVFYPAELVLFATTLFPFLAHAKPWMFKAALYVGVQTTILGLGLRALGRVCNDALMHAWHTRQIVPVHVGAKTNFH